jgi:hypothetical protein
MSFFIEVFKITKWLENKVFPLLGKDILKSMSFLILSTPLYKLQQCDSATFDIFKFDFEALEGIDVSLIKTKVSDQIRFGLLSLLELLQSNRDNCRKMRYFDQQGCGSRLQVSMNFVLEHNDFDQRFQKEGTKSNQSCVNRACLQSSSENEQLFENYKSPTNNPLQDIMKEISSQKDDGDIIYQTNIVELNDHYYDINVESMRRLSPFATYQNFDILAQLSQEDSTKSLASMNSSRSNCGNQKIISDEKNEGLFQLIHSVQSLHHSVMVYHKQLKIDDVSSIKTFEHLFGNQPSRYLEHELNSYVDTVDDSIGSATIEYQKKRDRDGDKNPDVSLRRRKDQVPPTLTPMRPSRYSTSQLCRSRNVSKTKIDDNAYSRSPTFQSISNNNQHSFVTPNNPVKRKSQCISSEAPTIVVRLSSCLDSNSPLHSSVTPQNS